jgi:epoxyqueuosine reductase
MENIKYCEDIYSSSNNIIEMIKPSMSEKGYAVQIVSIEHLKDLQKDIEILKNSELTSDLINIITNYFYSFELPDVPFKINSVIIAASPKPLVRVKFNLKNNAVSLLHHTYVDIDKTEDIKQNLKELINGKGYNLIETAGLPQKLLAVRSGLAKYGRNNITYVEGMGSLQELTTFYSDIPCTEGNWHEVQQMDLCKACRSCVNICPTAAITEDRYLIRAERCMTYLNEFVWPEVKDFPSWLDPSAHNCIHGCILCQTHCPQNKKVINKTLGPIEFNEEETTLLLEGKPLTELPEELIIKLKRLNLADDYFSLLPRNLKALLL